MVEHLVGHVQPVGEAGRADSAGGEQHVDPDDVAAGNATAAGGWPPGRDGSGCIAGTNGLAQLVPII